MWLTVTSTLFLFYFIFFFPQARAVQLDKVNKTEGCPGILDCQPEVSGLKRQQGEEKENIKGLNLTTDKQ